MSSFLFLYHCQKPNSIIDVWTKEPSIAEELSRQGVTVFARRVKA